MGFRRLQQFLIIALALLPVSFLFQNCSSYNDPSPFEYAGLDSSSLVSGPADLLLSYPLNSINVDTANSSIRASGNCNVGLSKSHRIEVTMTNQTGALLPVREDATCPASGNAACLKADQFLCEHGKYNIYLPVNCSAYPLTVASPTAFNSTQTLRAQLVTVDANGAETRETKASFALAFSITWAGNICP
jgi:hypothetical protein